MLNKWVVVGDGGEVRVFRVTSRTTVEQRVFINPVARLAEHELRTDRPGRMARGNHSSSMQEASIKDHAAAELAREVAAYLRMCVQAHLFDQLAIVAAPHFLGLLRAAMDPATAAKVVQEVPRDVVHHSNHQIHEHLVKLLDASPSP